MSAALFDAASSAASGNRATSLSWGHTCTGDQRALYVWVLTAENGASTAVSFAGVAMTKIGNWSAGDGISVALWRLWDPPVGAQTIVASASTSCPIIGGAQSARDASQTEDGTWVVETGTGTSDPSNSIAAEADDLVIDCVALENDVLPNAAAGQTTDVRRAYSGFGDDAAMGASHEPGAATVTMGWDVPSSTNAWVHVMYRVKPGSVIVDLPLRWTTLAYFNVNLNLRWTTRSHAPLVDLALRWITATTVPPSDLALRWTTRAVVAAELDLLWFTDSKRIPESPLPVFTTEELLELQVEQRTESVRFEVVDAFRRKLFEIHPDRASTVSVQNNIHATIKRTLQGIRLIPSEAVLVNPVAHRVRPVWELENGAEFPLGVFLFGDSSRPRSTAGAMFETTLFDQTFILDQGRRSSYALGVGSRITDALKELATEVNLPTEGIEDAPTVLANPLAWPAGTTRLRIMNDLCAMCGFYSAYFDNNGLLRCRSVPDLEVANARLIYTLDQASRTLQESVVESDDLWEAANVYVVVSTSANDQEVSGSYEIPETNPLSVKNRGYEVVKVIDVQGLETSDEAAARAKAAALQDPSTYRHVEFDAAPDPRHDTFDVVAFDGEVYREQSWTLTCAPGGPHKHSLRRVDHIDSLVRPAPAPLPPPPPPTLPGAPGIGTASPTGDGTASVTFSPPLDDGRSPILYYTIKASTGGATANVAASPGTITGVTNGVETTFTVTATNDVGEGPASSASNPVETSIDALSRRVNGELKIFTDWVTAQGVKGYVGEVGWPWETDSAKWNALAEVWYRKANARSLSVSTYADSAGYGTHKLGQHIGSGGDVDTTRPSAAVMELVANREPAGTPPAYYRGSNYPDAGFGVYDPGDGTLFSNVNVGTVGTTYNYPSAATCQYLANAGIKTVRFPFRWERVQRSLNGALDSAEMQRMADAFARFGAVGIKVIPCVMNFCRYYLGTSPTARTILVMEPSGSGGALTAAHLVDLWQKLSAAWAANANVVGYDLMNEPHDLAATAGSFSGTQMYGWNDGTVQGWVDDGTSTTLTHTTTGPQEGTGSVQAARAITATGFQQSRIQSPASPGGTGNALETWVYLDPSSPSNTWTARLVWRGNSSDNFGYHFADGNGTPLVAGQWTKVSGVFGADPIDPLRLSRFLVRIEGSPTATGTVTWKVDNFARGDLVGSRTAPQVWEDASQAVLTAIRNLSDTKLIMVAGYQYSAARNWAIHHAAKWITDPSNNHIYEAHQYFDQNASGQYLDSYETVRAAAAAAGW